MTKETENVTSPPAPRTGSQREPETTNGNGDGNGNGNGARRRAVVWLILLLVAGIGFVPGSRVLRKWMSHETTEDAFIEGPVVQVASQVAGRVLKVNVADNQQVAAGQVLVELDPVDYRSALAQSEAALAVARSQVEEARAGLAVAEASVGQAEAEVRVAETTAQNAEADLKRYQELAKTSAISSQTVDTAQAAARNAAARIEASRKQLAAARSQVGSANARVLSSQAAVRESETKVDQARQKLSYTQIKAQTPGRVTRKSVEPGNYVNTGQALMAVVGRPVWVVANFKETQLGKMRPGQPVEVRVDAFPGRVLPARVDSIQAGTGSRFSLLPPENATGNFVKVVQRVPVKITFEPSADPAVLALLTPGMSVVPEVLVK